MTVFVNYYVTAEGLLKGLCYADVFAYTALENNGRNYLFALADVIKIVVGNGLAQTGNYILLGVTHLYFMHQIRLGKNSTSCGYLSGVL